MILQGQPNQVVQKRVRKFGGKKAIKPIFRFDENGFAEIDESKLTQTDILKLKRKFKVVENIKEVEKVKEEVEEIDENVIRQQAKKAGIKSWHVKKTEKLIKELEDIQNE